jgi:radical SAM superfamily enzyme YgiQ (UPF0313 family)
VIHIRQRGQADDVLNRIQSFSPDCIGFSLVTSQRWVLDDVAGIIRRHFDGPVIAGGVHPTIDPYNTLTCRDIDAVCVGEGELPLAELAERIDRGESFKDVPSMIWKGDVKEIIRPRFEPDINKLMELDYSVFNVNKLTRENGGYFYVMISRGCPFSCTYCSNQALRDTYVSGKGWFRMLDPADAIDHLRMIKEKYDIKGFTFDDDIIPPNIEWFREFSDGYRKHINLPYICNCRFEIMQSDEMLKLMRDTGCIQVRFGLESGDEDFRRKYLKRNYTDDQIFRSVELLRKYGIEYFVFTIVGFPYEKKEQMGETLRAVRAIRPHFGEIHFFFPYPGTELFDKCQADKMLIRMPEECGEDNRGDKPIIRLDPDISNACINIHRKLFSYFLVRAFLTMIRYEGRWLENALYYVCMLNPNAIFRAFGSRENWFRRVLRKVYLGMTLANTKT